MATFTDEARLAGVRGFAEETARTDSVRFAQNSLLSELPGVAFAFLTLAYVLSSFASLL